MTGKSSLRSEHKLQVPAYVQNSLLGDGTAKDKKKRDIQTMYLGANLDQASSRLPLLAAVKHRPPATMSHTDMPPGVAIVLI